MNPYDCQAPMYINFDSGNSREDLNYFNSVDHEEEVLIKEEVSSPEVFITPNEYDKKRSNRRRSRSVGDLQLLRNDNQVYQLRHAMNNMVVSESCESLDTPGPSNAGLSSGESKENLNGRRQNKQQLRNGKYETMAEQVNRFQRQTPKRFHSVTSKASAIQVLQELSSNQYIKPKTPRLLTKSRARPNNVMSYEERKELEYQESLKNKIKSRKFCRDKLFKAPSLPNVARMPVTKFEPFKLSQPKKQNKVVEEKPPMFKARSIPENIFDGPLGIKPRAPPKTTVPKTPNIKMPKKPAPRNNTPHAGVPNVPKQGPTKIIPFSFEERDKLLLKRKEEFVQKFMEEEKKKMEIQPARPMPKFGTPTRPLSKLPTIVAKSPNFASTALREEAERRFRAKLEQEELEAKAKAAFKARPAKVLEMKPFEPELPHQHVEVQEFVLSSEIRAKARQAFDEKIKQKEQEHLLLQQEQEIQRKKREEEELVKIRKALVPKAQPIRHFKPVELKRSDKEMTHPTTPKLGPKYHTQK